MKGKVGWGHKDQSKDQQMSDTKLDQEHSSEFRRKRGRVIKYQIFQLAIPHNSYYEI